MGWEFEGLFDMEAWPGENDLLTEFWKTEPSTVRIGAMGYRTKTIKAGPRLEAEVYPIFGRETAQKAREAKKNITPEKMQRLNYERSIRHLIQLADANFTAEDISLTLTYRNAPKYEQCRKDMRNFMNKIKRRRAAMGLPEMKYIYTIEGNDDGRRERIHVHMLMSGGLNRDEIEKIWEKGYANADRLRPDENGLEAISRYITKQQKNRRKWCQSRNLVQPKTRTSDTKVSNGKVKKIAFDFRNEAKKVMEKIYPGYTFVKCQVKYSEFIDGVYIRCVMRKWEGGRR